jgi:arsenite-transporting ATPase
VERFIYWVKAFEIPVGGVIVNQVMPPSDSRSSFIVNKQAEQEHYLELIDKKFGELVTARIPMFDVEIRGVEMLKKTLN